MSRALRCTDEQLRDAYHRHRGNHTAVAREVGLHQKTAGARLTKLGLPGKGCKDQGRVTPDEVQRMIKMRGQGKPIVEIAAFVGRSNTTVREVLKQHQPSLAEIRDAFYRCGERIKSAARELGVAPSTVDRAMQKLDLKPSWPSERRDGGETARVRAKPRARVDLYGEKLAASGRRFDEERAR